MNESKPYYDIVRRKEVQDDARKLRRNQEMSRLTKIEQETVINFNAGEEETVVYTKDKAVKRRFDSLVTEFPDVYRCIKVTDIDKTYSMLKQYVSYCKPRRITEVRRDQIRAQMADINSSRNKH